MCLCDLKINWRWTTACPEGMAEGNAPSMMLRQRGLMTVPHQSESTSSRGTVTSLLDLAAARQLLAHCDQVWHPLTGDQSGTRVSVTGKLSC